MSVNFLMVQFIGDISNLKRSNLFRLPLVPILLVFVIFQKYLVHGIGTTGLKS